MKKFCVILSLILISAVSCYKQEKAQLERLQGELSELEGQQAPQVPDVAQYQQIPDGEFAFIFDESQYGVDAGCSVSIGFTLQEESAVEAVVKEGWSATVSTDGNSGTVTVTAPDPARYSEITLVATSQTGRKAVAVLPLMVRDPYSDATRPGIDALGYYSFKPWNATLENYRKLADAGITIVTVETDEDDYLQQMDLARQVGIKVLAVVGWATGGWYDSMSDESLARLTHLVETLKDRPELYGYHIYDEPSVDKVYELMAIEDKMMQLDPDHPIYVNLHPNATGGSLGVSTYYEYVETFASMMHLKQLSFDIYPILEDGPQGDWHMCLSTVADAARRYGIPLWTFAASCWIDLEATLLHRARPSVETILLQTYTNLAYGAQTVQYFTIQDYGGTDFAPIMRDGTWTEAYDFLKEAVLQMQKRAFIFKGCEVKLIRQIGLEAPFESMVFFADLPDEIENVFSAGSGMVSFVENNGNKYMIVLNNDWRYELQIAVTLNKPAYLIDSDANFTLYEAGEWGFMIPKGGMLAFKYR